MRDPYLDNVKCVAILLVVIGHSLGPVLDSPVARTGYLWIYAFHMPVFVFLAGHLSRSYHGAPRQARAVVTGLLVPYAVFQVCYVLQERWLAGERLEVQYVDPVYVLWFLVSLATWRLAGPVLVAVRWPVLVAVVVSLAGGLSDALGEVMSLGRTAALLPFFVAGLVVRREHLALLSRWPVRAGAVVVAAASIVPVAMFREQIDREWIYWRAGYGDIGLPWPEGMAVRAAALAVGAVLGVAFLALVPRRRSVLSALGAGTMTAFLLHGLVLRLPAVAEWFADPATLTDVATAGFGGLALGLLLLSPPVRWLARPLVEPPVGRLLLRARATDATPATPVPGLGAPERNDVPSDGGGGGDLGRGDVLPLDAGERDGEHANRHGRHHQQRSEREAVERDLRRVVDR